MKKNGQQDIWWERSLALLTILLGGLLAIYIFEPRVSTKAWAAGGTAVLALIAAWDFYRYRRSTTVREI
ncbi:hypothetical protein [Altererythrobacter sp. MTPC7]|uniref:hypothetical protein n=1 Tax=Altererythrobacter sp. MTPC7 TaxID=3056567 RepID=UPI0036F3FD30